MKVDACVAPFATKQSQSLNASRYAIVPFASASREQLFSLSQCLKGPMWYFGGQAENL